MKKPKKAKMGAAQTAAYAEQLQAYYEQAVLDKRRYVTWIGRNGRVVPKECLTKIALKRDFATAAMKYCRKLARLHGIKLTEPEVEE